jgi:HEAT repeat protein
MEAAKALGNIGGHQAIQALISALEDDRFEVRWEAAEALIKIGRDAVKPLLKALIKKSDSTWMREGAHHVFSDMEDP